MSLNAGFPEQDNRSRRVPRPPAASPLNPSVAFASWQRAGRAPSLLTPRLQEQEPQPVLRRGSCSPTAEPIGHGVVAYVWSSCAFHQVARPYPPSDAGLRVNITLPRRTGCRLDAFQFACDASPSNGKRMPCTNYSRSIRCNFHNSLILRGKPSTFSATKSRW